MSKGLDILENKDNGDSKDNNMDDDWIQILQPVMLYHEQPIRKPTDKGTKEKGLYYQFHGKPEHQVISGITTLINTGMYRINDQITPALVKGYMECNLGADFDMAYIPKQLRKLCKQLKWYTGKHVATGGTFVMGVACLYTIAAVTTETDWDTCRHIYEVNPGEHLLYHAMKYLRWALGVARTLGCQVPGCPWENRAQWEACHIFIYI